MPVLMAAILGAVSGLASACLMTLFESLFWRKLGISGVVEWQTNQILTSILLGEQYDAARRLKGALLMHLFHGLLIGAILAALLMVYLPVGGAAYLLAGPVTSMLLWVIVPLAFRKRLETAGRTTFTQTGMSVSFMSHLVFGISLGLFLAASL